METTQRRGIKHAWAMLGVAGLSLLLTAQSWALTDVQTGAPGNDANASAISSDADNTAIATGGAGVDSGNGGAASAKAVTTTSAPAGASATAQATGGAGDGGLSPDSVETGGNGGSATANATATNSKGAVNVAAVAEGGAGGAGFVNGGAAGGASATASGVSLNGGEVAVSVTQRGGTGGASGGGYWPTGGAGADSILLDAATGSTKGLLALEQIAVGGAGGAVPDLFGGFDGPAGTGGTAVSSLIATNAAGGSITGTVEAHGGAGGNGPRGGAVGGAATVWIALLANRDVEAHAVAGGGAGQTGGGAVLEQAYGRSLRGGNVTVSGEASGGDNRATSLAADAPAVHLSNQVDGDTAGNLWLRQVARAGNGGVMGGAPASSVLTVEKQARWLSGETIAEGGGSGAIGSILGSTIGGDATALCQMVNTRGGAEAVAEARGGAGVFDPTENGPPSATAQATAPSGQIASAMARAAGADWSVSATSEAVHSGKKPVALQAIAGLVGDASRAAGQAAARAALGAAPETEADTAGDHATLTAVAATKEPLIELPSEFMGRKNSTLRLVDARAQGRHPGNLLRYELTYEAPVKSLTPYGGLRLALLNASGDIQFAEIVVTVDGEAVAEELFGIPAGSSTIEPTLLELIQLEKRQPKGATIEVRVVALVRATGDFALDLALLAQR